MPNARISKGHHRKGDTADYRSHATRSRSALSDTSKCQNYQGETRTKISHAGCTYI